MRNTTPSPFAPCGVPQNALEDAFQRAHARATAPLGNAALPPGHPPSGSDAHDDDEPLLDGQELLRVVREPIEWLLTLAHRLASDEPDDVAAIDRLRAAFHARLAGRPTGVRMTDALTGFALLLGALDPNVVLQSVTRTIADGVATLFACESAVLAAQLAHLTTALPATSIHHACDSHRRRGRTARPTPTR